MSRVRITSNEYGDAFTGKIQASYVGVAENTMAASEYFPAQLRIEMEGTDGKGETHSLSLGVPLTPQAGRALGPFFDTKSVECPHNEPNLRNFIKERFPPDTMWVYASKGFIRSRLADPGTVDHFVLHSIWKTTRDDGSSRIWFAIRNEKGHETTWHVPYPDYSPEIGETPEEDLIEINMDKWGNQYLALLGLDWDKFEQELESTPALWDGHDHIDTGPVKPFFQDSENITPELLSAIVRHGPNTVEVKVVGHPTYGPGPRRIKDFVQLTPVKIITTDGVSKEGATAEEFDIENLRFAAAWSLLTEAVSGKENATLTKDGSLTDEGRDVAVMVMVPIVGDHPEIVKEKKEDGAPAIVIPPTIDSWELDGLVAITRVAEELLKQCGGGDIDLTNMAGLVDREDPSKIVAWANDNVPELSGDFTSGEVL